MEPTSRDAATLEPVRSSSSWSRDPGATEGADWGSAPSIRPWTGTATGGLLLVVLTSIKLALYEQIGAPTPFLPYFGAVLAASWIGGSRAGFATTAAAAALGLALFVGWTDASPGGPLLQGAMFAIEGAAISILVARIQVERRRAITGLQESSAAHRRLLAVLEGVDEGITVQDPSGRLVFANDAAARYSGFDRAEDLLSAAQVELARRFEVYGEDQRPFPFDQLPGRRLLRQEEAGEVLLRFHDPSIGADRWSVVRASPIRDADGRVVLAINLFRDVTAGRRHDETLRVTREWLSTALRSIGDAVLATDSDGVVTFLNPMAEHLTGWSSEEATGRPLRDLWVVVDEDTRRPDGDPAPAHPVLVRRDGVEIAIDQTRSAIRDDEGRERGAVLVFRDVTQRRRADRRRQFLARSTEELGRSLDFTQTLATVARLAVPSVADWSAVDVVDRGEVRRLAVAHVDPLKVALVDEIQARYPEDPEQSLTRRVFRTGTSEMGDIGDAQLAAVARDEEHLALIRRLGLRAYLAVPLKRDGEAFGVITFAMAESRRSYDENDLALAEALADRAAAAVERARLFSEQVEARRLLEGARAEAERANRSKDEFLAVLGHELRNPLAPILTALQILRMRQVPGVDRERAVIERQVRHMVRLVDDLLDISRITRGTVELGREPVDLADVVARALEMTTPLVEQRRHQVQVRLDPALNVLGDAVRLSQVLANLISNAAKYTNPSGRIEVDGRREGFVAVVTVKDDGIGMSRELISEVFEPFVQGHQPLDRADGGLGLGLAIARRLVQLHGGSLEATSDGPGRGSTLTVRLPATDDPTHPGLDESDSDGAAHGVRVLLVDDNADALDTLSDLLALCGHQTFRASDGPSALVLAAEVRPDLALLDIGLPVMDGYELAARLRTTAGLERMRLVALTGYGLASDRDRALAAGFDEHLVKPIAAEVLEATIERLTGA